ncbi:MAG: Hsp70 family protein [Solobacterium sp.]|nr:Hsp70 family protein [Solobacterium sp.]
MEQETIIGIDLGTSTTEAAVYRNGVVEMILSFDGEAVIPSAVGIDDSGSWVIGRRAKDQVLLSPEKTAIEIKRKIGTSERIAIGNSTYTATELSSRILGYVRSYASEYLGEDIRNAVISVPAYFDDRQRQETLKAGELAGFHVERILNEPTAAALSYGLEHMEEESHILVYDLGGGTFDVTLLEMFEGVLDVKASSGDNQLGGKDFDSLLIEQFVSVYEAETGRPLKRDARVEMLLKNEAESCKMTLSEEESCRVIIPALSVIDGKPAALDVTVTREEFEAMANPLMMRTHHAIDVVLHDSGIKPEEIDRIILVGGSTRMPIVEKDIEAYLGSRPQKAVNPDYAVSEGAAIQAALISGEIDPAEGILLTDVNPYSLGVHTIHGDDVDYMAVIIPRNVTIPVKRTRRFYTYSDNQTSARIVVYQGEHRKASQNHFLGNFLLSGIPAARAGKEALDVSFSYDQNGLLSVTGTVASTGEEAVLEINMMEEIDTDAWADSPLADPYRRLIRRAERKLKHMEDEDEWLKMELSGLLQSLKYAIVKGDEADVEDLAERLGIMVEK